MENRDGEVGLEWDWPPWQNLPQRYKLIGTTSLAFVVCNMDKVNLSVAIIPMSHQFGWNASVAGLVQLSFFWGYALSQLPGGWLAKIFGGRKILQVGVLVWSLATSFVPILAGSCQDLSFPEFWLIPIEERSCAVSFVFSGLSVGSVLGSTCLALFEGNPGSGLFFGKHGDRGVAAYTDADYACSVLDRRSTSGYCTFVWENLVTWKSKKQPVVARSSAEAEFRSMALGICELLWLKILLRELHMKIEDL